MLAAAIGMVHAMTVFDLEAIGLTLPNSNPIDT